MRRTLAGPRWLAEALSMRRFLRRTLLRGVTASLVLPVLLAIVLGLGALMAALGDRTGAALCVRVAQAAGVLWVLAVVATAVAAGLAALDLPSGPRRNGGRGHRHWRRRHRYGARGRHFGGGHARGAERWRGRPPDAGEPGPAGP